MSQRDDTDTRWKEKYLDVLDAQEQQEKHFAQQRQLLTRAMVRVSVAADGQHPQLDEALEALRTSLRGGDEAELQKSLSRLDQVLLAVESNREDASGRLRQAFDELLDPLSRQELAASQKKSLRQLSQDVSRQRELLRACPELLERLAVLQRTILLGDAPAPLESGGFLSRVFGANRTEARPPAAPEADKSLPEEDATGKADRALFELNPNASLRDSETVSRQLRGIVTELLASVEAQAVEPARVAELQQRLQGGMRNADLIPVLEQVRDLVMSAYVAATRAFTGYLNDVNQALADIHGAIGSAASHSHLLQRASEVMQADMLAQFSELDTEVSGATDLKVLQTQVQVKLGSIRAALSDFQRSAEKGQDVGSQLTVLVDRIKSMEQEANRNREVLEQQRHKALHDPLTGVPNREAYNERIAQELTRTKRYGNPLTLAVCDLDYFKKINDSLGHQAGDRVLKVLSNAIAKRLRKVDFFGRYGGEEFVVILPETSGDQALGALDKIRAAIAKTGFSYKETPLELTVSVGLAQLREDETADALFDRADRALYAAKAAGRNQCILDT